MPFISDDYPNLPDGYHHAIYPGCIPEFAASTLDALYGSLYSSLPTLQPELSKIQQDISTYVRWCRQDSQLKVASIFLFLRDGSRIRVINEGMHLNQEAIDDFCEHLFTVNPLVNQIDFHAIAAPPHASSRPHMQCACTEDIVITLPRSDKEYLAQLGKSTRRSLRKHLSHARCELPDFSHTIHEGKQISEPAIQQIVAFNHARMAQKYRQSALDQTAVRQLANLLRERGTAGFISTQGRICAGTLACRIGDAVFSLVTAHDPKFDHLSLGNLSRHLMILTAISSGAHRFHLLGGKLGSKRAALGIRQKLDHLRVYRSRSAMGRDIAGLSRIAAASAAYHLRRWIDDQSSASQPGWIIRSLMALGDRYRRKRQNSQAPEPALMPRRNY